MLPVWQEVPHHSVGQGLMFNCAKRQHAEPTVNLYHVSSLFLSLWKTAPTHVCIQRVTWACSHAGSQSISPYLSHRCSMHLPYTPVQVKVSVWQDIFLTLLLSLSVSLTHSLTISLCCYWNVCVCWCGLWNWWMTSHGRFIVRILVQLERKLMASWDYGGLRANTCLFHQETWGHFFTPSQIRASPPPPPVLLLLTPSNSTLLLPQHRPPLFMHVHMHAETHTCSQACGHIQMDKDTPLPSPKLSKL